MDIWIDSANVDEIKKAVGIGLCDGVTTNPSLIAKEHERTGKSKEAILTEICDICDGPVLGEVDGIDYEDIMREAGPLTDISKNIVIKIPFTEGGLKACKELDSQGIDTCVTLIFNSSQALLAAKAGATYIAPFVGRLDDMSQDGMDMIEDIVTIYTNYDFDTEIIVASVRHPEHFRQSALMGADAITVPFSMVQKLMSHPLTADGIAKFQAAAAKTK